MGKCLEQVEKFEGAAYKAFETFQEASAAFDKAPGAFIFKKARAVKKTNDSLFKEHPEKVSVSVDAAWNTKTKQMEYQGVYTLTGELLFSKGPFNDATNNVGEFLAIVHALALLKQKNSNLPIYSDSQTAIKWIKDKNAKTKLIRTEENKEVFELLARAEKWLAANTYSNRILKWNTEFWGEIPADFGRK